MNFIPFKVSEPQNINLCAHIAALEMKELHSMLAAKLQSAAQEYRKDMKQVANGIWIHSSYPTLGDALKDISIP